MFYYPHNVLPRSLHSFPTRRSSDLIQWAGGGGHLVVVSGWRRADALRYVKVNDPFYSSGDIRYEDLAERYGPRSEEHTSELQSQSNLVCRLLLEKKKKETRTTSDTI